MKNEAAAYIGALCVATLFVSSQLNPTFGTNFVAAASLCSLGYFLYINNISGNLKDYDTTFADQTITDSLSSANFGEYRIIDPGEHDAIISMAMEFTDLYKRMLLGQKDVSIHFSTLVEMRKNLLNTMNHFYVKQSLPDATMPLADIIQSVAASTYRSLNILKVKYNIRGPMYPTDAASADPFDLY